MYTSRTSNEATNENLSLKADTQRVMTRKQARAE